MYPVPNELIRQFEGFSMIIRTRLKDLVDILVSCNNQETFETMYDFKTELVMPRTVAGFRLYNIIFAYSCVLNFIN